MIQLGNPTELQLFISYNYNEDIHININECCMQIRKGIQEGKTRYRYS